MITNIPVEKRTYQAPETPKLKTHEIHKDRDADGKMPWYANQESKVDEQEESVIVELNTNYNNKDLDLYEVYSRQGSHLRKYI